MAVDKGVPWESTVSELQPSLFSWRNVIKSFFRRVRLFFIPIVFKAG